MVSTRQRQLDEFKKDLQTETESIGEPDRIETIKPDAKKKEPSAYYDSDQGRYYMKNDREFWINVTESSVKRFLRLDVYGKMTKVEGLDKAMDEHLLTMQRKLDVEYAGPLAGFPAGLHTVCNNRVLVTKGPFLLRAQPGEWSTLKRFIDELLGVQAVYFHGWMKFARQSMLGKPPFRPGQMLCFAGPPGCGKSVLQGLITDMLGGRSAHPFRYMIGDTKFNSDLFYAEHLMIEDEAASTSIQVRRDFGSKMKSMIVNVTQSFHRKTKEALPLTPFWRLTCSLNNEPENLMVLPPLDESIKDKIILLLCSPASFPGEEEAGNAFAVFLAKLKAEIPAYLAWLRSWRMPKDISNRRFGVVAFQHAELLETLEDMAPEVRLMGFIDTLKPGDDWPREWKGTASDLEAKLLEKDRTGRVAKLLTYSTACGVYLARLKHRYPDRVKQLGREDNRVQWQVIGPKEKPVPS